MHAQLEVTTRLFFVQENEAAAEAPGTPDEKSFVDDDGTIYEWDPTSRRFLEVGAAKPDAAAMQAAAADAAFDQEQQTFSFEAEEIPAMPDPEPVCPPLMMASFNECHLRNGLQLHARRLFLVRQLRLGAWSRWVCGDGGWKRGGGVLRRLEKGARHLLIRLDA